MGVERDPRTLRTLVVLGLLTVVAACSSGSDSGSSDDVPVGSTFTIEGSIGDGPIVDADIVVRDSTGSQVATGSSDQRAQYNIEIPSSAILPLTVHVTGGMDLVTQRGADFELQAQVNGAGQQTVNVSPLTTLAVQAAECRGDSSNTGLNRSWDDISREMNIGLDTQQLGDPMTQLIDANNLETAVLANESLGELIRRAGGALPDVSLDDTMAALACDIADGRLDGTSSQATTNQDDRIFAVMKAAEAAIRLEVLAGRLQVDGFDSTARMNDAIRTVAPEMTNPDVNSVPMDAAAIDRARDALVVLSGVFADAELTNLVSALAEADASNVRGVISAAMNTGTENTLTGLTDRAANIDVTDIQTLQSRTADAVDSPAPVVSLGAEPTTVQPGQGTTLSWASSNAEQCDASWSTNEVGLQGIFQTGGLQSNQQYTLVCTGLGGSTTRTVAITVLGTGPDPLPDPDPQPDPEPDPQPDPDPDPQPDPDPDPQPDPDPDPQPDPDPNVPEPTVSLSANDLSPAVGGSVTLSWSSTDANSCSASGGWSGNRGTQGQASVGPISSSTTFTLTCTGDGGSAVAMINVHPIGAMQLSWQAPTENVDGTPLDGLNAYRIHYGSSSRNYSTTIEVSGNVLQHTWNAPVGTHYVALTAVGTDDSESDYSNEVLLTSQ